MLLSCAFLLALADAGGYYTSYSYSSGAGGCNGGKCSSSRSISSPSMRSIVNNCSGNCCSGTTMGRSGNCLPSKMATSSYSISSTKPRFTQTMPKRAMQMISRSSISKPANSWSSWSSWGSKTPSMKTSFSSSAALKPSSLGKAWGSKCVLCNQPSRVRQTVASKTASQKAPRRGCPNAHTRVGSSCRRSSALLTGPAQGKQPNETGNCYRVGGHCQFYYQARNTPPAVPTYPPPTTTAYYPIEVLDYESSEEDDQVYVDCIDCDANDSYQSSESDYQNQDYQNSQSGSSDYSSSEDQQYHEAPQGRQALRRRRITSWNSWGSSGQEVEEEERQEEYYQPRRRRQQRRQRQRQNTRRRRNRNTPYRTTYRS